jgi:hypothetical protein
VYSNAANPSSSSYWYVYKIIAVDVSNKTNFSSSQSCYHDIVFQSLGDTNPPTTMFWCGTYTTGGTVYRISPQRMFSLSISSVMAVADYLAQKLLPAQPLIPPYLDNQNHHPGDHRPIPHLLKHQRRQQKIIQLVQL